MSTNTLETVTDRYEIRGYPGNYYILKDGLTLFDEQNQIRFFKTRNSARKRVSRERSGNFHR
jgi:hypothetical protein